MLGVVIPQYNLNGSCATEYVLDHVRAVGLSNEGLPALMQAVADNC
ncbi:MAG: hypothetical protein FD127_648 [Acidimicrobiaceae bacterium]|nr:MAG: hypothetical protein FD127_648 [Acidimicrobiaceae bacterium]